MSAFEIGAFSSFVGTLPILLVVIAAWIHVNSRMSAVNRMHSEGDRDLARQLLENREAFKTEIARVEEVLDSRLRRLEES